MDQRHDTPSTDTPSFGAPGEPQRLLGIIADLRRHCRWTAALTHASLVEYLVEESYELLEAIETGADEAELRGELADVLYQLVLHSAIAAERGAFDFTDVAAHLSEKMIRRNTHVFHPDGSLRDSFPESTTEIIASWDAAKRAETPARTDPFSSLPRHLPALALADKALDRAARWTGHDGGAPEAPQASPGPVPVPEDVPGTPGTPGAAAGDTVPGTEEELGALLFGIVAAARSRGLDAERSLRTAVVQYMTAPRPTSPGGTGTR
ncbi:MazG nucleotide pyrophosphohydrolase domain-containing protein [Arthrobacter sp. JSM 101049]|uniref:MazG nucleotide pyrophosphohydrolase domain-containing protein n=1 Tax=Arthrobacter sp. JSM 101049 TaxID=929097 RepID=UPI0035655103